MDGSWFLGASLALVRTVDGVTHVVAAWLLTYAVHSTVLLLGAWGLVSVGRIRWSPAAAHAIWGVAMIAGGVTATAQRAAPRPFPGGAWQLTHEAKRAVAAVQVLQQSAPGVAPFAPWERSRTGVAEPRLVAGEARAIRMMVFPISRAAAGVGVWAIVALALAARLAIARRRLHALLAARRRTGHTLAAAALHHLAAVAGVRRPVTLSTSDALQGPAAISSDEIVLPVRALQELSLAEQEGVLAHELAHVARRDTMWLQLALVIEALAWFQPLNRVARRAMQRSAEFAADQWAVRVTRQPLALARALARVAGWAAPDGRTPSALAAAGAAAADGSPFVARVRRLTSTAPVVEGRGARSAHAAMLVAVACALAYLPRVDLASTGAASIERFERFEVRLDQEAPLDARYRPRAIAHRDGTVNALGRGTTVTRVQVLRPGNESIALLPVRTLRWQPVGARARGTAHASDSAGR